MTKAHQLKRTLFLLLAGGLGVVGCSHRTPYLRDSTPDIGVAEDARNQPPVARLVLVGDAGEASAPVLDDVRQWAGQYPDRTIVLFLGDNFYPEGMTRNRRDEASRKLLPQIAAATAEGSRALFIPGNHDWDDGGPDGYEAVLAQASYIRERLGYADGFLPADGCPGPEALDLVAGLRIVAIDTQWWLHEHAKPVEGCRANPADFSAALTRLLATERTVVIAAHHPLFGYGRHAGFSEWREHLLPPIVGTSIALKRKVMPRVQDYESARYRSMSEMLDAAIAAREQRGRLVIWAAGHEHSLQVLEGRAADYVLISGSAAKTTPVTDGPETLFAHSHPGFMVMDLNETGQVRLQIIEPGEGEVWATRLDP